MHTRPSVVGANSLPPNDGHRSRQRCLRQCSAWPTNNCHNHQRTQDQLDASSDGVIRLVTPILALMLGAMAISFVAGDRLSPRANLLSMVTQWTGSQLSPASADTQVLDCDGTSRMNDDGYLEGLQKAL